MIQKVDQLRRYDVIRHKEVLGSIRVNFSCGCQTTISVSSVSTPEFNSISTSLLELNPCLSHDGSFSNIDAHSILLELEFSSIEELLEVDTHFIESPIETFVFK